MIYQNYNFATIFKISHGKTINSIITYTEDSLTPYHFSHFLYFQKEKSPFILSAYMCNHEKLNGQVKERKMEGGKKEGREKGRKLKNSVYKHSHTYDQFGSVFSYD